MLEPSRWLRRCRSRDSSSASRARPSLGDLARRRQLAPVEAVAGVSFSVVGGEVLAIVGESGCGKTTTANMLLGLLPATEGRVLLDGREVGTMSRRQLSRLRRNIQMIFQDPYESLNPRMRIAEIVAEPLRVHAAAGTPGEEAQLVHDALSQAGMTPPEAYLARLPVRAVGRPAPAGRDRGGADPAPARPGRRRAGEHARRQHPRRDPQPAALACRRPRHRGGDDHPRPVDRRRLRRSGRGHVPGPNRGARTDPQVLADPQHPYTRALLSVVPVPDPSARRVPQILSGETPDPSRMPSGCRFHPRCPVAFDRCRTSTRRSSRSGRSTRRPACWSRAARAWVARLTVSPRRGGAG